MSQQPPQTDPNDEMWNTIARWVAGDCSAAESEVVRRWVEADPARAELVASLDRMTRALAFRAPSDLDVEAALRLVRASLEEPGHATAGTREVSSARERDGADLRLPSRAAATGERSRWRRRTTLLRAAAVVALVLAGAFLWQATRDGAADGQRATVLTYQTAIGRTDSLELADGTRVLLGPASRLDVQPGFGEEAREVVLAGDALFDVPHDSARPFVVRAGGAVIRDLGTTFGVRSDERQGVRVVVTSGSVSLQSAARAADAGVVLRAGDRGALQPDGRIVAQPSAATTQDLAWTRGELVFEDAPLSAVATELRRWYGIEIRLADSALASRRITTTLHRESVEQVLEVLSLTLGARIERAGDTAIVHADPRLPR